MKGFGDTLLVAMLPLIMKAADVATWVVIVSGSVSTIWVLYQLILKIRKDLKERIIIRPIK